MNTWLQGGERRSFDYTRRRRDAVLTSKRREEEEEPELLTSTVRLTKPQWAALRRYALDLAEARGGGRLDASAALRAILTEWMKHRGQR
jgi:hypothetical protein